MKIESYEFGCIIIDGKQYNKDLIIFEKQIFFPWVRKQGHNIILDDLPEGFREKKFDLVIIGRGYSKKMAKPKEILKYYKDLGIECIAVSTEKACKIYNEECSNKNVAALLHLTC